MGCLSLTVLGGASETVGLLLVALELTLTQRREFRGRGPVAQALRFLQRLRRRMSGRPTSVEMSITATAGGGMGSSAEISVETSPQGLDQRVERLEHRQSQLETRLTAVAEDLAQRVSSLGHQLAEQNEEAGRRVDRLEQERRTQLEQTLRFQWPGTFLFVAGVMLSVGGKAFSPTSALCPWSLWSVAGIALALLALAGLLFALALRRRNAEATM